MSSGFDKASFFKQRQEGGFKTHYPVIPQSEYPAILQKWDARVQELDVDKNDSTKGKRDQLILTAVWKVDDDNVRQVTGLQDPTVRQDFWADCEWASKGVPGKLLKSEGKNIALGRFLDSFGMNLDTFAFDDLIGKMAIIEIVHTENKTEPDNPYQKVSKVVPIA